MRMEDVSSEGLGPADALQAFATLHLADAPALLAQALGRQQALLRENQQFEAARQQMTARWLATEAVAGIGSYELDLASGAMHFSEGLYRLFGEVPHSFVPPVALIDARTDPADAAAVQRVLAQVQADKQPYRYTRRVRRANGQWRTFTSHGQIVCTVSGAARRLEGVVEDKPEQYQAEHVHPYDRAGVLRHLRLPAAPDQVPGREASRQTRVLSHELTPATLEELGLKATLQSICRALNAPSLHWHCRFVFEAPRATAAVAAGRVPPGAGAGPERT